MATLISGRAECGVAEQQIGFLPAMVVAESAPAAPAPAGATGGATIEIEFESGARMRITGGAVDAATLTAAVAALGGGRPR